jgi:DNA-binding transcriptional LysR family regulator
MDRLTSMRVFAQVARAGSFAAAARELNMSKAMVSKHVSHLENALGARLLNRNTRHFSLTEAGAVYLERCSQILEEIEEAGRAISDLNSEPRGVLRINAPPSFGAFHLTPLIAEFMRQYPKVRVELALTDEPADLVEEGYDLAIYINPPDDSQLIARRIASARLVVCGAPEYLRRHGMPERPEDLKRHNCLTSTRLPPRDVWRFRSRGEEIIVKVSGTFRSNVGDAVQIGALNGLGLALLPTYMAGRDLKKGRLQAVLTDYEPAPFVIYALYPDRRYLPAKVRAFLEFCIGRLAPVPYWDEWDRAAAG